MVSRSLALLAAGSLTVVSGGCAPSTNRGNEDVVPKLTLDKVGFRVYRGTVLTVRGDAESLSFRRDTGDLAAERIDARFPATGPSRPEAHVTAARGSGNVRDRRFEVDGGVLAEQGGQVATTERARYLGADGLIRGDRPIEVRGGRFVVRGPSFTLDPRDQLLRVEGGAAVTAGEARR
jgi:redox-sensitive bicupin YhaK (pirin superfamily)